MDNSKQKLEINIIDKEKNERSKKPKQILFSIAVSLFLFVFYFRTYGNDSFDTIYIKAIMMLVVAVLAAFGIAYKFRVPSKGKIIFEENRITIISKNMKTDILIPNDNAIVLYQFPSIEGEVKYIYELNHMQKKYQLELDIVFKNEKEALENLKNIWKSNGADVQTINTPPNR